jgi:exopolysaccharide biosynthesis polyprenyl glycosylphosphotransferase
MMLTNDKKLPRLLSLKQGSVIKNDRKIMILIDEQNLGILDKINYHKEWGYQVIYILTDSASVKALFQFRSRVYSMHVNIRSLLRHDIVDEIVCCTESLPDGYFRELTQISRQFGVSLLFLPSLEGKMALNTKFSYIGPLPFLKLETSPRSRFAYGLKTTLEIALAFLALFFLSPVLILIAFVIKITSQGPVIFKQLRVGLRGRKFYIYKFRTMVTDAEKLKAALMEFNESDGPAFKIRNDPRITHVGKFLRKTGLDEIPQLFNVMRGEMSLIGPRPMLPQEVVAQEEWQLKRLSVKPGITCTWQVLPRRNAVPFDHWMKLDKDYVENWSIRNDLKLIFKTIRSLFAARGM